MQFKEKQPSFDDHAFHNGDTAKNPVIYPSWWHAPQKPQPPTILHYVGFLFSGAFTIIGAVASIWWIIKTLMEAMR